MALFILPVHEATVASMVSSCVTGYRAALDRFFVITSDFS